MRKIIDYIFPHLCLSCNEIIDIFGLCDKCNAQITYLDHIEHGNSFKYHISCTIYQGLIRQLIINYKSYSDRILSYFFAEMLFNKINKYHFNFDYIAAVPAHFIKIIKRGFNQVQDIVNILSKKLNKKVLYIYKKVNNPSQVGKTFIERQKNVKDIFYLEQDLKKNNVLLIDDVYTTGSTINSCSLELLKNNVHHIYALTIAKVIA